ncbi:IS701 family transposase, partial [Streptomyces atratus]
AYGQVKHTRFWLEERGVAYVLATKVNDTVITTQGGESRVDALVAVQPHQRWKRLSGGAGAHGERIYDWARVPIRYAWENGFGHWVLARRSVDNPSEIAYYVCFGPVTSRLKDLVRVAAARWAVEECFQSAKGECGLDHYQVRLYRAWYRHITLAMAAHAYLTAVRAAEAIKGAPKATSKTSYPSASRTEVGTTPLRWLTAQRLLEARPLLESTDLPVDEVARRCGLGTAANLRLHLARDAATTPTAYRRAFRGRPDAPA